MCMQTLNNTTQQPTLFKETHMTPHGCPSPLPPQHAAPLAPTDPVKIFKSPMQAVPQET